MECHILSSSIYQINNWSELFVNYEQLNSIKLCQTCWSDKVKVFNYFNKMAKTKQPIDGEQSYKFKKGFEDTEIYLKGNFEPINNSNLNSRISEIIEVVDLMSLIELV